MPTAQQQWDSVNGEQDRITQGIRQDILQKAMMRQTQEQQARQAELARRMQDIREKEYADQSEDRKATILAKAKAASEETARKAKHDQMWDANNRAKVNATVEKNAQAYQMFAQKLASMDAGQKEKALNNFVTSVSKNMDSAHTFGMTDQDAQSMGKLLDVMPKELLDALQTRAPAALANWKGAQRIVDGGQNPFPIPGVPEGRQPNAVIYKQKFDEAVQNEDATAAAYYQKMMDKETGQGTAPLKAAAAQLDAAVKALKVNPDDVQAKRSAALAKQQLDEVIQKGANEALGNVGTPVTENRQGAVGPNGVPVPDTAPKPAAPGARETAPDPDDTDKPPDLAAQLTSPPSTTPPATPATATPTTATAGNSLQQQLQGLPPPPVDPETGDPAEVTPPTQTPTQAAGTVAPAAAPAPTFKDKTGKVYKYIGSKPNPKEDRDPANWVTQ